MVEAEKVQHGGEPVVVLHDVFDGVVGKLVSRPVNMAFLKSTASGPHAETERVMVAPDVVATVRPDRNLNHRQSSHFAAPVDERLIEQSALFKIGHQCGGRLIDFPTTVWKLRQDRRMMIPALAIVEDLHEAHTSFHESPRDQAARAVVASHVLIDAVHFVSRFCLLRQIKCFIRRQLHSRGKFVAGDAGVQIRFPRMLLLMFLIHATQKLQLLRLSCSLQSGGRIEIQNARFLRTHDGALINRRQIAARPVFATNQRQSGRMRQCHKCGQLLRFAAERVSQPASERRSSAYTRAGIQGIHARQMIIDSGMHGTDQRNLIRNRREMRDKIRQLHAAFSARTKSPCGPHDLTTGLGRVVEFQVALKVLAVALRQLRLWIK